jgi:ABC-type nitrate/sulfonate/bicarbonate transport system substrate-binding protein
MVGGPRRALLAALVVLALVAVACGGEDETASSDGGSVTALMPINSANVYGFKLAEALGYYEDEGLDVTLEYVDGSGEAITQMLAGRGEVSVLGTGTVIEGLEEGHTDLRVIGNVNYGSVFFLTAPEDGDLRSPEDMEGKKIGISELSGGEVPVVRGIVQSAGLDPDTDVELVPIGTGTALAVEAIREGRVDAYGGSINDIVAVEVQGLPLVRILPEILTELPGLPVATTEEFLSSDEDTLVSFMRATTMAQEFGQVNPDAAVSILKEQDPEQYTDETGKLIFEGILPLWRAPEGQLFGEQSVEQWQQFADFIEAELPEGADLSSVIVEDFPERANDYDHEELQQEAEEYQDA